MAVARHLAGSQALATGGVESVKDWLQRFLTLSDALTASARGFASSRGPDCLRMRRDPSGLRRRGGRGGQGGPEHAGDAPGNGAGIVDRGAVGADGGPGAGPRRATDVPRGVRGGGGAGDDRRGRHPGPDDGGPSLAREAPPGDLAGRAGGPARRRGERGRRAGPVGRRRDLAGPGDGHPGGPALSARRPACLPGWSRRPRPGRSCGAGSPRPTCSWPASSPGPCWRSTGCGPRSRSRGGGAGGGCSGSGSGCRP